LQHQDTRCHRVDAAGQTPHFGHAAIPSDTYSHAIPAMREDAAVRVEALVFAAT